jgi:hypothetical protein
MKLNIFSDRNYLPDDERYEPILYPFWGKPLVNSKRTKDGCYPWKECFNGYIQIGESIFELSSLENADLAILPYNWAEVKDSRDSLLLMNFLEKAKQSGKLSVSFFGGDQSYKSIPAHSDLVFRNSMYASTRKRNDFASPAWGEDFIKTYFNHQLVIREKQLKPTVGFCGFSATDGIKTYAKSILYDIGKLLGQQQILKYNISHILRMKALPVLENSPLVKTNFIIRDKPFLSETDLNAQDKVRMEYIQNILDSDYIFCCRGYGNFSFRFYEALSCGRIPVFINSQCVLPYDFEVDWKQYCVWVEEDEISCIAEKIVEFHERLQPKEFVELQYECRKIWEQWLSPEGFFANLYRHIPLVLS